MRLYCDPTLPPDYDPREQAFRATTTHSSASSPQALAGRRQGLPSIERARAAIAAARSDHAGNYARRRGGHGGVA